MSTTLERGTARTSPPRRNKVVTRRKVSRNTLAYALMLPALVVVFAVTLYPIFFAAHFSLHRGEIVQAGPWVGLRHYEHMITSESIHNNVYRTLVYLVGSIPLTVIFGLVLALILNRAFRGRTVLRTIVLLPWITSYLVSALLWRWLLNADYGPVVALMTGAGLPRVNFFGTGLAMTSLVLTTVWNAAPLAMIILLAALQQVPENLEQAAAIDGADAWMRFRRIVFPLIRPSILVTVIILSLHFINIITLPLVLTGGGPGRMTEILPLRLYNEAFVFFNTGFASAIAIGIFFLNVALTFVYIRVLRRRQEIY